MALYSHVIYACYQNMPQNVFASCYYVTNKFAEIIYILTNSPEYLYHTCFVILLHIYDFTFIMHARKRQSERL